MKIELGEIGKRFRYEWIFKNVDYIFETQQHYALLGANGSGKSTLMKIISGHLTPSKGKIIFSDDNDKVIDADNIYRFISYAAPYIELIEEFTLKETILFHQQFKKFQQGIDYQSLINILGFEKALHKEIRFFSSGMKQRLKLALAICAESPILLLDEPTTNLDSQGAMWYRDLLSRFGENRLSIIATNVEDDFAFYCTHQLNILDYK
jgi:ABC-type multidrug transport system ATPase subunit